VDKFIAASSLAFLWR